MGSAREARLPGLTQNPKYLPGNRTDFSLLRVTSPSHDSRRKVQPLSPWNRARSAECWNPARNLPGSGAALTHGAESPGSPPCGQDSSGTSTKHLCSMTAPLSLPRRQRSRLGKRDRDGKNTPRVVPTARSPEGVDVVKTGVGVFVFIDVVCRAHREGVPRWQGWAGAAGQGLG